MTLGSYTPRGTRRVVHCSDMGSHFGTGTWLFGDPAAPDDLRRWIGHLADAGVDAYTAEVYFDGLCMYYRSDRCETWDNPKFARFNAMMDDGVMPLDVFVDEAHRRGMELVPGFRINDRHGVNKPFFEAHPDWLLKDLGHGVDYSIPQVRDWMFSIIKEVPDRFDVDGIEINFIRHCYCFPPAISAKQHPIMTDFMRRVRQMLDEVGRRRGRHLLLGARTPPLLDQCTHYGFDIATWVDEKLIDYLAPSDFHCVDMNVKHEQFAELTRASDSCFLYPAIQGDVVGGAQIMSLDNLRAAVHNFYAAGADGFSTHNYDVYMWGQLRSKSYPGPADMFPKALDYFHTLRDPQAVAKGDRHYRFEPVFPKEMHPEKYRGCAVEHRRAILKRDVPGATATYRFRLCEHLPGKVELPMDGRGAYSGEYNAAGHVPGVWLVFRAMGMCPRDQIVVEINGREISTDDIRLTWHQHGRPRWKGRSLPPYTECEFDLTAPPGVYGDNVLGLRFVQSAGEGKGDIVVDEVEVIVNVND